MPFDILPAATGLAATAYERLGRFFTESTHHRPSEQQWAAIRDLMSHLELASQSALPNALYLSAIPAGCGKTSSLAVFARTLMDSPDRRDVGMVVFVNRNTEVEDMAKQIGEAYRDRMCLITSRHDVRSLGALETATEAQVCVSTQAALRRTLKELKGAPFAAAKRFHFRGQRRAVVCWDEAFAFNRPVVLDGDTVTGLAKAMRWQSPEAATTLKRWAVDVDTLSGLIPVPDFVGMGVNFDRLEDDVGGSDEMVSNCKALEIVSGDEGFITRQGAAAALVTTYPDIPPSLMPVIVTDASAKVNASYVQMARTREVTWLVDAPKTYRNMTLRLVPTAASRSVFRDTKTTRGRDLLDLAARHIGSLPAGEKVLVVGYKSWFKLRGVTETKLKDALQARLSVPDKARMAWLEYGSHTATNDYREVKHVLLLGLNFIPRAAGHAASGAALDLDLKREHPTEDQIREIHRGMLMDSTLQALLRGNARNSVAGDCGEMEAVVFQTKISGLSDCDYLTMFPGVKLVHDRVLLPEKPLRGRLQELAAIVTRRLSAGETEFTNPSLYDEMGMARQDFAALVKKPEWLAYITGLGLRPQKLRGRVAGLKELA